MTITDFKAMLDDYCIKNKLYYDNRDFYHSRRPMLKLYSNEEIIRFVEKSTGNIYQRKNIKRPIPGQFIEKLISKEKLNEKEI